LATTAVVQRFDVMRQCTRGRRVSIVTGCYSKLRFGKLLVEFNCSLSSFRMEINLHP
jgi:hypothetical protein